MKGNCGECDLRWACDIAPNKCNEWPDPAPMTNADRIRSMSDEELCKWLFQRDCKNIAAFLQHGGAGVMNVAQLLDWLQQPAEADKNGV